MAEPKARPVTDEDRRRVAELHSLGHSRNEIARRMGRSGRTVSRLADDLGLDFERGERTRAATEAKKVDAAARRAQLALDLLSDAARLRQQLWQPTIVYSFGGRDNTYEEHTLPEPPHADKLRLVQAVSIAADRSLKLDEYDRSRGADDDKSMLLDLRDALRAARDQGRAAQ